MSDSVPETVPPRDPAIDLAATEAVAKAEAAATRRRWINLGEFVAVAGLLIAGASLYLNWSDHRADEADKRATAARTQRESARFDVRAVPTANGATLLLQHDDRHAIRDATVTFPSDLGIGSRDTVGDAIDREWFKHALLKSIEDSPDKKTGRLPVLIVLTYWDGDTPRTTRGIYDIGWKTEDGPIPVLSGRSLKLESLHLHELGGTQARLDAVWNGVKPKPKP